MRPTETNLHRDTAVRETVVDLHHMSFTFCLFLGVSTPSSLCMRVYLCVPLLNVILNMFVCEIGFDGIVLSCLILRIAFLLFTVARVCLYVYSTICVLS